MNTNKNLSIRRKVETIRSLLQQKNMKEQLARAIPKHLSVDRLLRVVMTSVQKNPKLLDCTPESLLASVMTCAQLGLEPDQFLGQAYLVPFWNGKKNCLEAQLIPGYRGYIALARRSGELQSVTAQVVRENDHFVLQYGLEEKLEHIPAENDRGKPKGAYVVFKYKDGSYSFDYMTVEDIEKIRKRSKTPDEGPWVTDWDEMAKKTVIKRHAKLAPLSVEFVQATRLEDYAHAGESQMEIFSDITSISDDEDLIARFDEEVIPKSGLSKNEVEEFITIIAEHYGKSSDEIRIEAVKDQDSFLLSLARWQAEREKTKTEHVPVDEDAELDEDESELPGTSDTTSLVICPKDQQRKAVTACEPCEKAKVCGPYQEYLFEADN